MAAPRTAPAGTQATTYYTSPDVVPDRWTPDRPGIVQGLQPEGPRLGAQGPDQGYALTLANRFTDRLQLQEGERTGDALRGCVAIALRRASLFGRAPVIHDLTLAFTIWGFLDPNPPTELVAVRRRTFEGVGNVNHHYAEGRAIADRVPESTLRMTVAQVQSAYPAQWGSLTGAV